MRKHLKMNRTDFARTLGVTMDVLANYELGRTTPQEPFVHLLCLTHHVSLYWLKTGNGVPFPDDDIAAQLRIVLAGMDDFKVDTIIRLVNMPDSWWAALKESKDG